MTRAEQRLILSIPDEEKWEESRSAVKDADMLVQRCNSYLQWLMLARDLNWPVTRDSAGLPCGQVKAPFAEHPAARSQRLPLPQDAITAVPSKMTVTELKGRAIDLEVREEAQVIDLPEDAPEPVPVEDEPTTASRPHQRDIFELPRLRENQPLTAAQRGTATHLALQLLELHGCADKAAVTAQLKALEVKGRILAEQVKAVDTEAIVRLMQSPLGQRIQNAEIFHQELKFSLLVPAQGLIGPEAPEGEEILLQGVIDGLLKDENGWLIVDFKTDRVKREAVAERAEQYRNQLQAYAYAVRKMMEAERVDTMVYFLVPGVSVSP